ncbi:MAG: glycosyltransferase family 4 protein [Phycisphaeraceae bacterium]|nr:glycosyltransferase family 4 protein [Phycisphaeraceae bacterium]
MRIGLDARTIFAPQRRGIGKSLLRLYQTLATVRPDWEIIAYHRQADAEVDLLAQANLRFIEMPGDRFDAWLNWRLPFAAYSDQVDVLHCPANQCPRWLSVPTLVTIHDLIPLDWPEVFPAVQVRRFRRSVRQAVRRASGITCPSHYTRRRLVRDYAAAPQRVFVTEWGCQEPVQAAEPLQVLQKYRVEPPFVLHFGSDEMRKNTQQLIEAWALMRRGLQRRAKLLILGLSAAAQQKFMFTCQHLGVSDSVLLEGFADEAEAGTLLSCAEVLAYPSLSEGFGLPLLEAFASGTAVMSSDCTALSEVAGDAALMVDPQDSAAMSSALGRLLRDVDLRRQLAQRGRERIEHYSWTHCAQTFALAVESVAGRRDLRKAA